MSRVLTNNVTLQASVETVPGTTDTSPTWYLLEPNTVTKFGATVKTEARAPISKLRQQRYGTVVDLDSGAEFAHDVTQTALDVFMEGFFFALARNRDCRFVGEPVTSSGYTIPAATSGQAAKFQWVSGGPISLVYARGYANAGNNGQHALTSDLAASATAIPITSLTVESSPPANVEVELCGVRATAGDLALTIAAVVSGISPPIGTLASGSNSVSGSSKIDFTTLGLTVGQFIHIGGLLDANRFAGAGSIKSYGYARIRSIAAAAITVDKMSATLIASDGTSTGSAGSLIPVDLLFGRFHRNVAVDNVDYLERSFSLEASWPTLGVDGSGTTPQYSYSVGNYCDKIAMKLPLSKKAEATFTFTGFDTPPPTTSRNATANAPILPSKVEAFNTTADIARLRVTNIDETGLTTDFKDLTINIGNAASAEKVIGKLGAKFMNFGNFTVDMDVTLIFTNDQVIDAVRNNTLTSFDFILRDNDGAIVWDIPSFTLGDGSLELPVNQSVNIKIKGTAVQDQTLGTSLSLSMFPVVPQTSA